MPTADSIICTKITWYLEVIQSLSIPLKKVKKKIIKVIWNFFQPLGQKLPSSNSKIHGPLGVKKIVLWSHRKSFHYIEKKSKNRKNEWMKLYYTFLIGLGLIFCLGKKLIHIVKLISNSSSTKCYLACFILTANQIYVI